MRERNDALERRIHDLERKARLDLDHVQRVVERIRRPEAVATALGAGVRYSQRVEAEVAGLSIETLLPHAADDYDGRFLAVWVPDELGHGYAQEALLRHLDLPTFVPRGADVVPLHNRDRRLPRPAVATRLRHGLDDVPLDRRDQRAAGDGCLRADGRGRRASSARRSWRPSCSRRCGATSPATSATTAPTPASSGPGCRTWQLAVVRALVVHTYAPVGAGCRRTRRRSAT